MTAGHPLVGRDAEHAALVRAACRAREGHGAAVLIGGQAGVGKTALVRAALDHAALQRVASLRERDGAEGPCAVVLDDAQWADEETLRAVPVMARGLRAEPLLLVVCYRDDELGSGHLIRRLRAQLRRDPDLLELTLAPLDEGETTVLLERGLGRRPAASLAALVSEQTGGVPFLVTEVATALAGGDRLTPGPGGGELTGGGLPLPEGVRDAVLLALAELSSPARRLVELVAVAGPVLDAAAVAAIAESDVETVPALVRVDAAGRLAFRHALIRDAVCAQIPRPARQALLVQIIDACLADRAYDQALPVARRMLELSAGDAVAQLEALERLAACAELGGAPTEAARAWRQIAERCGGGDALRCARAWRRYAGQREIQGRWDEALAAREAAAENFARGGAPAEAATERLAAAAHLRSAASFRAALSLLELAARDAAGAEHSDLQLRIRGLEGNVRARMGDGVAGVEQVRAALSDALAANAGPVAAEMYQRLADSLEHRGDYVAARATYDDAAAFCNTIGAQPAAELCLACLAAVLRAAGDWSHALSAAREVLGSPVAGEHARAAAGSTLGVIHALRGDLDLARAQLLDSASLARRIELTAVEILCAWGLAIVADVREAPDEQVIELCHRLLDRWRASEDLHYAISPLRWAATALAQRGDAAGAGACAAALTGLAAHAGRPEAMSALSHALGETAMLDGDHPRAVAHFQQAIELLAEVGAPLERMQSEWRAGVALLACGQRDDALERLLTAYHLARRLRVRPSIQRLAAELAGLGERVDRRLSRRQAEQLTQAQLTRREVEVLRLLTAGATNREIAAELVLSVRTVDMHVRNILRKLDCRTRVDAARRAGELSLVAVRASSP